MAVFLGLGHGELPDPGFREVLAHRPLDGGRGDEELLRGEGVAVVLHHARVLDLRPPLAVELGEIILLEGRGHFEGPVAAEVEVDDRIPVFDRADGLAVLADHEGGKVLVDDAGFFLPVGLDGLAGRGEKPSLAEDVDLPSPVDHGPVGPVAVHRDEHASSARGDAVVDALRVERGEEFLEGVDVLEGARFPHVPAVEEGMDPGFLDALGGGPLEHGLQVVDVGMDVPVRKEADEMEGRTVGLHVSDQLLPGFALEHRPGLDGLGDELRSLGIDAAAADRVVPDLAVSHVVVAGKADREAMGLQLRVWVPFRQLRQGDHI